jgi:hypothetical protein
MVCILPFEVENGVSVITDFEIMGREDFNDMPSLTLSLPSADAVRSEHALKLPLAVSADMKRPIFQC